MDPRPALLQGIFESLLLGLLAAACVAMLTGALVHLAYNLLRA